MPELEWPELECALASLVADVAKESDIASSGSFSGARSISAKSKRSFSKGFARSLMLRSIAFSREGPDS